MTLPERTAIIGLGVIGGGWAARMVLHGADVVVHDPDPAAVQHFRETLSNARRALAQLFQKDLPKPGRTEFVGSLADAVEGADLVIESVPERVDLKQDLHRAIENAAPEHAVITSSTSGIRPSVIQSRLNRPERMLVAHPFNPVYLLPLVELCGSPRTGSHALHRTTEIMHALGMRPLVLRSEIDGFLADRLMEALWREALWLVHDHHATTAEVDDAIRFGAGLRWAMMGTFQTFCLAGGAGGIRSMLEQFGPCLQWPWSRLTEVPELSGAFVDRLAEQCEAQSEGKDARELERIRDEGLVRILQGLEAIDWAAGQTVAEHRLSLHRRALGRSRKP